METKGKNILPFISVILGNVIWGFSFLFKKVALSRVAPDMMLAHRFTLATLFLLIIMRIKGEKISLKGKRLMPAVLVTVLMAAYHILESYGLVYTNSTIAGMVLAMAPMAALGTGALFLKEYPTLRQILFCILPVAGVILMTAAGNDLGVVTPIGLVFLAATCLSSAGYKTANRKAAEDFSSLERTFMGLCGPAAVFTVISLIGQKGDVRAFLAPLGDTKYLLAILTLSLVNSILADTLVNYALGHMSVFKVASFGALSTLVSTAVGVLILHEPMNLMLLVGGILILTGIREVTKEKKKAA